jgi:hypothetical protein
MRTLQHSLLLQELEIGLRWPGSFQKLSVVVMTLAR